MGFVVIVGVFALSSWILFATLRRLVSQHVGIRYWLTFGGLVAIGVAAGYWLAFHFEYAVSTQARLGSFPIPVCVFHLEYGQWVDFPSPEFFAYPAAFTNVVAVTAFAVLPMLAVSMLRYQRDRKKHWGI